MKSFFFPLFVATLLVCCCMVILIAVTLVARPAAEWKVLLFVVPNVVFLAWATREMLRTFRQAGRRTTRSVMP